MLTKSKLPLLILFIICLESLVYLWAFWTSTLDPSNFFAIESDFIFDKCARNSGRVAAALNLSILLLIGFFGLTEIYRDSKKKESFRILVTVFAVHHLIHFFFVFQTFKHHTMTLALSENKHGFLTFVLVLLIPLILWHFKHLTGLFYGFIILHIFNVSYFIMETFYNKVKPDKPAYHNQVGIVLTIAACLYCLYSIFRDYQLSRPKFNATNKLNESS